MLFREPFNVTNRMQRMFLHLTVVFDEQQRNLKQRKKATDKDFDFQTYLLRLFCIFSFTRVAFYYAAFLYVSPVCPKFVLKFRSIKRANRGKLSNKLPSESIIHHQNTLNMTSTKIRMTTCYYFNKTLVRVDARNLC